MKSLLKFRSFPAKQISSIFPPLNYNGEVTWSIWFRVTCTRNVHILRPLKNTSSCWFHLSVTAPLAMGGIAKLRHFRTVEVRLWRHRIVTWPGGGTHPLHRPAKVNPLPYRGVERNTPVFRQSLALKEADRDEFFTIFELINIKLHLKMQWPWPQWPLTCNLFHDTMFGRNRDSAYVSPHYPRGSSLFVVDNAITCQAMFSHPLQ